MLSGGRLHRQHRLAQHNVGMSIRQASICGICVYHAAGIFDDLPSNARGIFVFVDTDIAGWLESE